MAANNKHIRVSDEVYKRAAELAQGMRPKTTLQYLIDEAITQYLDILEEHGEEYRAKPKDKK
jgi:predicted transcriptional regulator